MELHRFISLLAASVGLIGAIFLSIGVLILSDKDMVHSTYHYSAMGWPSKQIVSSMATQKAHTIVGVIFIISAFSIQVISLIFLSEDIPFVKSPVIGVGITAVLLFVLTVVFFLVDRGLQHYHELNMEKLIAKDYCANRFENRAVDPANVEGLAAMAQEYFNLKREVSETQIDFIKRIGKHIGWIIPNNIDFSRINSIDERE